MFIDINSNETVTVEQLLEEYNENKRILPDEFDYSFDEYVSNCLTINGGTLERC